MSLSWIVVWTGPGADVVMARLAAASEHGGQLFDAPYGDRTLTACQLTLFRPGGAVGITLVAAPPTLPPATLRAALARARAVVVVPEDDVEGALDSTHLTLEHLGNASHHPLVALLGHPHPRVQLSHPDPMVLLGQIADQLQAAQSNTQSTTDAVRAEAPPPPAPRQAPPLPAPAAPSAPRPAPLAAPAMRKRSGLRAPGGPTSVMALADDPPHDGVTADPLARRSTVRYFARMNPQKLYPVMVAFTREQLAKAAGVAQVEGAQLELDARDPVITVVPVFPGCLCTPQQLQVDLTPETVEVRFWLTPLVRGRLGDARVEIHQHGRCLDRIPTPAKVADQALTRMVAVGSALAPLGSKLLEKSGLDPLTLLTERLPVVGEWLTHADPAVFRWGLAGGLALIALGLYAARRAKMAPPVDHRFVLAGA
ncbi:MAG: hypothetical protein ACE366_06920 [Bradymonadia bacterium]